MQEYLINSNKKYLEDIRDLILRDVNSTVKNKEKLFFYSDIVQSNDNIEFLLAITPEAKINLQQSDIDNLVDDLPLNFITPTI